MDGLFDTLSNKFCLQHNEMIKSFQYCKLNRQSGEKAEGIDGKIKNSSGSLYVKPTLLDM